MRSILTFLFLLLLSWSDVVLANGIAIGVLDLVFKGVLVVVVLIIIFIAFVWGPGIAAVIVLILLSFHLYFQYQGEIELSKKDQTLEIIEQEYVKGCGETTRSIYQPATGTESVYIKLIGLEKIPDHQKSYLIPKIEKSEKIQIIDTIPSNLTNALIVTIEYARDKLPVSIPGYEWYRSKYKLQATSLPGNKILAETYDAEKRNGFCLGELNEFLMAVLNRNVSKSLDSLQSRKSNQIVLHKTFVKGVFSSKTSGRFWYNGDLSEDKSILRELLVASGCQIETISSSPDRVQCHKEKISLNEVLKIFKLNDGWLLVYLNENSLGRPTSLIIEKRATKWNLLKLWQADFVSEKDHAFVKFENINSNSDGLNIVIYSDKKQEKASSNFWYESQLMLAIPLPELNK